MGGTHALGISPLCDLGMLVDRMQSDSQQLRMRDSPISLLLVPEGPHGIDLGSGTGWHVAGKKCDRHQD